MATPDVLFLLHKRNFQPLVLMGVEVRCVASERHQFISASVVVCLRVAIHPWFFSTTAMTHMSSRTAYRAATRRRSLRPSSGCVKQVHRSRPVRACCFSCKVLTLRHIVSLRETKSERHPVDALCLNFNGFANVVRAEKETTTQTVLTLLPVRHSIL